MEVNKTTEEKVAIMQAFANGEEIQEIQKVDYLGNLELPEWKDVLHPAWDWAHYDYRLRPFAIERDRVISLDAHGFPIEKMNLREIIKRLGAKYNEATEKWEIADTELLDIFPRRYMNDTFGGGVFEEWISNVCLNEDDGYCDIITEPEMNNLELFLQYRVHPGSIIYKKLKEIDQEETECVLYDIHLNDDNEPVFECKYGVMLKGSVNLTESDLEASKNSHKLF